MLIKQLNPHLGQHHEDKIMVGRGVLGELPVEFEGAVDAQRAEVGSEETPSAALCLQQLGHETRLTAWHTAHKFLHMDTMVNKYRSIHNLIHVVIFDS